MPIYDFECENCDKITEVLCKVDNKDNPIKCPACSGMMNRIEVQQSTFQLKGSGWYSDGYEKKEKKAWDD